MNQISWKEFLETVPPYSTRTIENATRYVGPDLCLAISDVLLHCDDDSCGGPRLHSQNHKLFAYTDGLRNLFVLLTCKNCHKSVKTYAIAVAKRGDDWICFKYGEYPLFGERIPAKMLRLLQPDKDLLLKGRQCENQGLGIAAFTYYRRVIENQRDRIFDELIRVTERITPQSPILEELRQAKKQKQFTASVEAIKTAIPDSLMLNGYNPLTLLHNALSDGVHNLSDQECLQRATAIRTVMSQFAMRLAETLREDRDLVEAINLLANKKQLSPAQPTAEAQPTIGAASAATARDGND